MESTVAPPRLHWIVAPPPDEARVQRLRAALGVPLPLCRLLAQRGFGEPAAAKEFLRPLAEHIHPPLLAGIDAAVARLARAIRDGETILVHGDYDVDGICATALCVRSLRAMGARAEPFVPHRVTDGYDLSAAGVAAAARIGAGLILTCDCGITAHEPIRAARNSGIDVVVTDHHTPGSELPASAAAVVNPNRTDCDYPNPWLCGTGVAYKVCCALAASIGYPVEQLARHLDLVALATVADLVPLRGENRALVRWGLRVLQQTGNRGLRALLRVTGLEQRAEISAGQVGFILAPRLNAVGRMADATDGVRLLLTEDPVEADAIARSLEEENQLRRRVDGATLREALQQLEQHYDPDRDWGVVLASERWHPGVIGIVASRVVEHIYRPTVMVTTAGGEGKGSGRSIAGFHLYEAIHECAAHLHRFGGHRAAAGCSLAPDQVEGFRTAFNAAARRRLTAEAVVPRVRIDLELSLAEADHALLNAFRHLGPHGMENPAPVLAVRGVTWADPPRVVGRDHLKGTLAAGDHRLDAIGFGMADRRHAVPAAGSPFDVALRLEENTWRGQRQLQARLIDIRSTEP